MPDVAVQVNALSKRFRVAQRESGLKEAIRALFRRSYVETDAVHELSFQIAKGECVGFLGPNGAGKTTTLKMLAGLLYPTSGHIQVAGFTPHERKPEFLRSISLVMGQKRQLSWDLPAVDTFELHRVVFAIDPKVYRSRLAELSSRLKIEKVMLRPVRELSLGERMKCELVAALLHGPKVLFLDEPTIGMDVSMQSVMRQFIREYNQEQGATVILTSHYMEDVAALCNRIFVIDSGRLCFDGSIRQLTQAIHPLRRVSVRAQTLHLKPKIDTLGHVIEWTEDRIVLDVVPERVAQTVDELLRLPDSSDLEVKDAPLEEVMRTLFAKTKGQP